MNIRFHKPSIRLTRKNLKQFKQIVKSGWVCNGNFVSALEERFAKEAGVRFAIACSSATQGLIIALRAVGVKGKKVALPSFTWGSTLYAIECAGGIPVFCDIDRKTWQMVLPEKEKIDFAVPVDIFGNQYPKISVPAVYDAAHGYGLPKLGKRGLAEVVSLSFTKPVTAMQGGMILTNSEELYSKMVEERDLASKMCEFNAVIALNSMSDYPKHAVAKKRMISKYINGIKEGVQYQLIKEKTNDSVFAIVFPSKIIRDRVADFFARSGVEAKIYYKPLIQGLPNTDWLYNRILALPTYPEIEEFIPRICELINKSL
jgi:dTDP-4-amino-4,6-dideoxygalactose transaminase